MNNFRTTAQSVIRDLLLEQHKNPNCSEIIQNSINKLQVPLLQDTCNWWFGEYAWHTGCMKFFEITSGSPFENGMIYCCYCGSKIKEV